LVKAAREVVREDLLGGAELVAGSVGSGNNWRRLPLAGCSRKKAMTGELLVLGFARWCHG
jgi:hypothetical protein